MSRPIKKCIFIDHKGERLYIGYSKQEINKLESDPVALKRYIDKNAIDLD